jgi:hypothetical protein
MYLMSSPKKAGMYSTTSDVMCVHTERVHCCTVLKNCPALDISAKTGTEVVVE